MQRLYASLVTSSKYQRDEKTMNKKGFRFRLTENKKILCLQMEIAQMTFMTYIKYQSKTNLRSTNVEGRNLLFEFCATPSVGELWNRVKK